MQRILLGGLALLLAACGGDEPASNGGSADGDRSRSVEWSFDRQEVGKTPPGFRVAGGEWVVAKAPDSERNVLAQQAKNPASAYNLILAGDVAAADVDVTASVHPVEGEIDRGGGIVWRAQDDRNYYLCRWNPLESNFRVYKVIDGDRRELGSAMAPDHRAWHELRAVMKGTKIECRLDGRLLLEVEDGAIAKAGSVGLWTKADAVTWFRDFRVEFR